MFLESLCPRDSGQRQPKAGTVGHGGRRLGRSQGVSLPFAQLQAASPALAASPLWFYFPLSTSLSTVLAFVKQPCCGLLPDDPGSVAPHIAPPPRFNPPAGSSGPSSGNTISSSTRSFLSHLTFLWLHFQPFRHLCNKFLGLNPLF